MAIQGIERIADVVVPDTPLAREATELIRSAEDAVLFHHSRRVFLFGALHGRRLGTHVDLELLYVAAMFHDLGLTAHYRSSAQRFELDGADAAREFLVSRGVDPSDADKVWLGIALHTTPEITARLDTETAVLAAGVQTDVVGVGRADLAAADIDAVVAAHPRPDFKNRILAAFYHGMQHRPETTFGTMNADVLAHFDPTFTRGDLVDAVINSPWPD
ncbi:HD domain-containing protein [Mycolicibacter hiberniae]|uniref:Putative metal-dependent phosphohydrolase n=1 Tax=Mycolicibacter hiberniae TaxID=29314 RepID=A0A7I7X2G4_9MYCO|nr:HD domain-containing protein [Mycolicibacter hiberniae]MCV7088054.1 HD domain-containing protein [Mycolicibacter hiberniae]ORV66160.1 diguanylate cyclase [Mycolicibacter hiberniae]BBZ23794.1 putative metal-dependent phosphohydrolase [Mycolicibacter hiberniae]